MTGVSGGLVDDGEDRLPEVASLAVVCDGRRGITELAHDRASCLACSAIVAPQRRQRYRPIDLHRPLSATGLPTGDDLLEPPRLDKGEVCRINPARFSLDGTVLRTPSSSLSPPSFLSTLARSASSIARSALRSPAVGVNPSDVLTVHSVAPQRLRDARGRQRRTECLPELAPRRSASRSTRFVP
jgi:hypothetical protein